MYLKPFSEHTYTIKMARSITLSFWYPHTQAQVWLAITNAEAVSQWLMPCDLKPEVGFEFTFKTKPYPGFDGTVHCKVLAVSEPDYFAYSWSGGSLKDTKVSFSLSASKGGTRLDFEHSGFEGFLNNLIVRRILASGWRKRILSKQLKHYLSK